MKIKILHSPIHGRIFTKADYVHAKRICKDFEIENSREYRDLYVQRDTLF